MRASFYILGSLLNPRLYAVVADSVFQEGVGQRELGDLESVGDEDDTEQSERTPSSDAGTGRPGRRRKVRRAPEQPGRQRVTRNIQKEKGADRRR